MDIGSISRESCGLYSQFQASHPLIGSMVAAEVIFVAGDAASQLISDKKIDTKKIKFTATLAPLYGVCINGLLESGDLVGACVSENPALKSALGPNLWGNVFNIFFFVNNTVGEKEDYNLKRLLKHYKNILTSDSPAVRNFKKRCKDNFINLIPKRAYLYSVVATLTAWNVFQYMNYSYVQDEMRTATALAASAIWTALLSLWSLRGRREMLSQ